MEKNNNKILIFFITLALLFWNPITFHIYYYKTFVAESIVYNTFFSLVFLGGIFLILRLRKKDFSKKIQNFIFTSSIIGIFIGFLIIINAVIGLSLNKNTNNNKNEIIVDSKIKKEGLIFEPYTKINKKTDEFDIDITINSLGLRNKEIDIDKKDKFRILCFGDSYTFGDPVNDGETYPALLEEYLIKSGIKNVEVVNCGKPGSYSTEYVKYIKKIIPMLKPDLVLVGMLEAEDLRRIILNNYNIDSIYPEITEKLKLDSPDTTSLNDNSIKNKINWLIKEFLEESFANYLLFYRKNTHLKKDDFNNYVKGKADSIVNFYTNNHLQKLKYYGLSDTVRNQIEKGYISSISINRFMYYNEINYIVFDDDSEYNKFAKAKLSQNFEKMQEICKINNCDFILLNIPIPITSLLYSSNTKLSSEILEMIYSLYFLSSKVYSELYGGFDFFRNTYLKLNEKIDVFYKKETKKLSIEYLNCFNAFSKTEDNSKYCFVYDVHYNGLGNQKLANYIGEYLINNKLKQ